MEHPETHLITKEHGPRPVGHPDYCFYCGFPLGAEHAPDCVMRERTVVMRYSFEVAVVIPESWSAEKIESHRNNGFWCADNALTEIEGARTCMCGRFKAEYVREATREEEEFFGIKESLV